MGRKPALNRIIFSDYTVTRGRVGVMTISVEKIIFNRIVSISLLFSMMLCVL